jgi:hypothetical protein
MPYTSTVDAEDVMVGDVIDYHGIALKVLRAGDEGKDPFGRPLIRHWCKRKDTGEEGYMSYGSGGVARLRHG